MKIVVDTNVLVRSVVRDHPAQARAADKALKQATAIAVTLPVLCEFVWVLRSVYGIGQRDICAAVRALLDTANVLANRSAIEAGLAIYEAGGDFADGLIAHEGQQLGADAFVSFDRTAVTLLAGHGQAAVLLRG